VSSEVPVTETDKEYLDYVNGSWRDIGIVGNLDGGVNEGQGLEELQEYRDFLTVGENPLMVMEEDKSKKRYKAYRKWLKGKSFFKQQPVD
jgi:hypothetical protein